MARVTLTFDNGPDPVVTPKVLDLLAHHQVPATFFVLGKRLALHPELTREACAQGHRVGSHTWSHSILGRQAPDVALDEFSRGAAAVEQIGVTERLFRPVGGGELGQHLLQPAVIDELTAGGYTCVLWNSVPGDWRDPHGWLPRALADLRVQTWTLLVLHDQTKGALEYLGDFLTQAKAEGSTFTQEYPPECVPIVAGRTVLPLVPFSSGQ